MTLLPLAATAFFMASGGPYGLEELVGKSGYGLAALVLMLTPLLWSLPVSLLVGELAAAMPEEGGFYVWVGRAMGRFWGFQEAWLSLVASVFDMGIYPTLFAAYLAKLLPPVGVGHRGVLLGIAMIAVCALWNLAGAEAVGEGSLGMAALLLVPFGALCVLGVVHGRRGTAGAGVHADLLGGVLVAMWNYMGWDNASTFAGEVERPQRTYIRAMLLAVAAAMLCYLLPVAAAAHAGIPVSAFTEGAWADVGHAMGGRWLELAIVAGGAVSALAVFNSLVLSYTRLPLVLAEDGYLPAWFRLRTAKGVPWAAVLACSVAWGLSLGLGFDRLVELDIILYGASLLLEFVALVLLRLRAPEMERPFRIPLSTLGCALLGVGPAALLALAVVHGAGERIGSFSALAFGLALALLGPVLYALLDLRRVTRARRRIAV